MKFIEVVPQYPLPIPVHPNEDYFTWPAKMMREKGFGVEIVSIVRHNQKQKEEISGITVKRFSNYLYLFLYLFSQRKSLIYAQGKIFPAFIGLFSKNACYNPYASLGNNLPKYLKNPFLLLITKFLFSRFKKIIAITPYEINIYKKLNFKKNYVHIYNGIDYDFFSQKKSARKFMNKYKIGKNEKVIIFVGNIRENVKNVSTLFKAFKLTQKKIKNIRLLIVGEKQKEELFLDLKNNPKVIVTGFLSSKEVAEGLSVASVFVNTSKNEGHSLAVSEAASASVPLCLSNIGSFTSVYKRNALYHNSYDYKKLSANIIYYLRNKKLFIKSIEKNKQLIQNECYFRKVKERLFKVLTENEYKK